MITYVPGELGKVLGSLLFAVGLILVCKFYLYLYTGKIGLTCKEKQEKYYHISLPIMLVANAIGAVHSHQVISPMRYLVNLLIVILCNSIGPLPGV